MSIKAEALGREPPIIADVQNVVGQLPGDAARGVAQVVHVANHSTGSGAGSPLNADPDATGRLVRGETAFTVVSRPEVCGVRLRVVRVFFVI